MVNGKNRYGIYSLNQVILDGTYMSWMSDGIGYVLREGNSNQVL